MVVSHITVLLLLFIAKDSTTKAIVPRCAWKQNTKQAYLPQFVLYSQQFGPLRFSHTVGFSLDTKFPPLKAEQLSFEGQDRSPDWKKFTQLRRLHTHTHAHTEPLSIWVSQPQRTGLHREARDLQQSGSSTKQTIAGQKHKTRHCVQHARTFTHSRRQARAHNQNTSRLQRGTLKTRMV